jgi:putative FmdB family regulatory protein
MAVPVYEYHCQKCGADFTLAETLKEHEKKDATCPECQAKEIERTFSSLQVVTSKKS